MIKRKGMPGALLVVFSAAALCTIASARAGEGLREIRRPVLVQNAPSTPQQQTPSGATQPSAVVPQSSAAAPAAPSPTPTAAAAPPVGAQGSVPTQGSSAATGPVREKETKETKETKEIKDRPSDLVEFFSAVAWPGAILLIIVFVFLLLAWNRAIQQLFGIAASVVQKIEIAGVKLEIDTSVVDEVKKFIGGSLHELVEKAAAQYEKMVSAASIEDRLSQVVREGLREILAQHNLNARPNALRATIHVPDIVFKDYMYQLVNYYPRSASLTAS